MADVGKDSYVIFTISTDLVPEPTRVVKQIVCDAGQELKAVDGQFYCGQRYLGISKSKTLDGRPMKSFEYVGKIPSGKMFCMGTNPDSYDGRYFGLTEKNDVEAIAYPLL